MTRNSMKATLLDAQVVHAGFCALHRLSSERAHLFFAMVDAARVAGFHGVAHQGEDIGPVVLDRAEALCLAQTARARSRSGRDRRSAGCALLHSGVDAA